MILIVISILVTLMYFYSGIEKMSSVNSTTMMLRKQYERKLSFLKLNNTLYTTAIICVILLEVLGPLIIVGYFSYKYYINNYINNYAKQKNGKSLLRFRKYSKLFKKISKIIIIALVLFTILATYLFHFPPVGREKYAVLTNICACGGLLLLGYNM